MKLLLLLSDETQIASRRDTELAQVSSETNALRDEVSKLLDDLLRKDEE
jgi:mediator of RNA polymerase II transcription subunit 22